MKRNISVMIKPSSSKCNLKCKYCFYHSISDARDVKDYGFMSKDCLREVLRKIDIFCKGGNCSLGFQGGECLLVGIEFYKELINYISDLEYGTTFNFNIQTNGTLINEQWAQFFKENNFLVGISLDGTKDLHNINRVNYLGQDTFNNVMRGINLLKKYEVNFNILVVVTSTLANKIEGCYNFFKKNDFKYLQFIPCLDPLEEGSEKSKYSLTAEMYFKFIEKLFLLWYKDVMDGNYISIRQFDNILGLFVGQNYESCDMKGTCSCQHIIESDGSVYPCDFYTYEKYAIGNILYENFDDMHKKEKTLKFIQNSFIKSNKCSNCKFNNVCRGGCRRHRENQEDNLNYLCSAYYEFYSKYLHKFREIANSIN